MANADDRERKVGYRYPPKEHQFQKGQSGNPKGRPRRAKAALGTIVKEELAKTISVSQNGEKVSITRLEAIIRRAVEDALTGTPTERRLTAKLLTQLLPQEAAGDPLPSGFIVQLVRSDEEL